MSTNKDQDNYSTEDDGSYDVPALSWSQEEQIRRETAKRFSPGCLIKFVCLPVMALAVVSALLAYFLSGGEGGSPFDLDLDLFRDEDPTDGETYRWRDANGRGLELTLINALDPIWHPYFDVSVQQWDNGSPDSLTLRSIVRDPDPDCTPAAGYLKLCNGDYGPTDWKGINKLFLQNGFIYQSIGKMNEHFLKPNEDDKKAYTMCHEIGHGFGLPHTDERFWNRNQGNCMDYTRRPASNKQPSEDNFNVLAEIYGLVGADTSAAGTSNNEPSYRPRPVTEQEDREKEKEEEEEDEDDRRNLIRNSIPDWVVQANKDMDAMIDNGEITTSMGWRKLHESEFGRALEVDLGEGYSIQVHYLLA